MLLRGRRSSSLRCCSQGSTESWVFPSIASMQGGSVLSLCCDVHRTILESHHTARLSQQICTGPRAGVKLSSQTTRALSLA